MTIDVRGVGVRLSEVLRGKVVRRVLLAMSRFGPQVRKVTVFLAEPVNPLGGVDQQCRMRAWLQVSDDVHSEAINGGFEAATARAATQLAKRVGSALDGGTPRNGAARAPGKREH
jgi:hypothetical protein